MVGGGLFGVLCAGLPRGQEAGVATPKPGGTPQSPGGLPQILGGFPRDQGATAPQLPQNTGGLGARCLHPLRGFGFFFGINKGCGVPGHELVVIGVLGVGWIEWGGFWGFFRVDEGPFWGAFWGRGCFWGCFTVDEGPLGSFVQGAFWGWEAFWGSFWWMGPFWGAVCEVHFGVGGFLGCSVQGYIFEAKKLVQHPRGATPNPGGVPPQTWGAAAPQNTRALEGVWGTLPAPAVGF